MILNISVASIFVSVDIFSSPGQLALLLAKTDVQLCPFKGMSHIVHSFDQAVFFIDLHYSFVLVEGPEHGDQGGVGMCFRSDEYKQ